MFVIRSRFVTQFDKTIADILRGGNLKSHAKSVNHIAYFINKIYQNLFIENDHSDFRKFKTGERSC